MVWCIALRALHGCPADTLTWSEFAPVGRQDPLLADTYLEIRLRETENDQASAKKSKNGNEDMEQNDGAERTGRKIVINYSHKLLSEITFSELKIKFSLVTENAMDLADIGLTGCSWSQNRVIPVAPFRETPGVQINIEEANILNYAIEHKMENSMLHQDTTDMNSASSMKAMSKPRTSFELECSEVFYHGVLDAKKKSGKLIESKTYIVVGTSMYDKNGKYGPILIQIDSTKTIGDVKKIVKDFIECNFNVSIEESEFQLYKDKKRHLDPVKELRIYPKILMLKMI